MRTDFNQRHVVIIGTEVRHSRLVLKTAES